MTADEALECLRRAYANLASEVWKMLPWDFARLTDWQIEHIYLRPQVERQEAIESHGPGGEKPALAVPQSDKGDWKPNRNVMVATFMQLGMKREDAIKEYAAQEKMNAKKR